MAAVYMRNAMAKKAVLYKSRRNFFDAVVTHNGYILTLLLLAAVASGKKEVEGDLKEWRQLHIFRRGGFIKRKRL